MSLIRGKTTKERNLVEEQWDWRILVLLQGVQAELAFWIAKLKENGTNIDKYPEVECKTSFYVSSVISPRKHFNKRLTAP
jgi:hypothetical protein